MAFDDIPEDETRGYLCGQFDKTAEDNSCPGSVTKFEGRWQCDRCLYDYGGDTLDEPDCSEL